MKGHNLGQEDGPKSVGPEGAERCCNFCGLLEEKAFSERVLYTAHVGRMTPISDCLPEPRTGT